jgi:glutaredoxin
MPEVTVYGTKWSVASWDVRRLLDGIGVPYLFVDLDADPEARAWAEALGDGQTFPVVPLVRLMDGSLLLAATRRDVARRFGVSLENGLLRPLDADRELSPGRF